MVKTLIFLLGLGCLLLANCKLEFVLTLHRHGARTANKLYKPGYWPEGKAQLTQFGREQMVELGKEYRQRYVKGNSSETEGFFPEELDRSSVRDYFVLSSSKDRAFESFSYLYQGLFNNSTSVDFFKVNITEDLNISEGDDKDRTKLYIFLAPTDIDFFMHGFDSDVCPKINTIQSKIVQSDNYLKTLDYYRKNLFPILAQETNNKWGTSFQAQNMTFSDMSSILDLLTSAKAHNITRDIPVFSDDVLAELRKAKKFYVFDVKFGDEFILKVSTTKIFRLLSKMLMNHFEGNRPDPKWFEISGHDTVIAGFLKSMLTSDELASISSENLDIPYSSHFEIEFHREEGDQISVIFIYNEQKIELERCGSPCTLHRFISMMENLSFQGDLSLLCQATTV